MKKLLSLVLLLLLILVPSCSKEGGEKSEEGLALIGTNFPSYDLLRTLSKGTDNSIRMLLPLGSESHSYEPTPRDIVELSKCDLFVYTGGESDEWVGKVLTSAGKTINTFILIDEVEAVAEKRSEGMEGETEEDELDEHVWTSLENEKTLALSLSKRLASLDEKHRDIYEKNAKEYASSLDALIAEYQAVIDGGKRRVLVFGDRFPLSHFVHEFSLDFFAAFPGCTHETEASARTVAFLIDKVKSEQIPVVFHIELSDEKLARLIASETGAKVLEWNTAHNVTKAEFEGGITYLDIAKSNLSALREALN
jgi:ABC-type metal ion transport system, periplasmic component/surface adhesin